MADFFYQEPFPIQKDTTKYRKISSDFVKTTQLGDREIVSIDPKALEILAEEAMTDVSFYLRPAHLKMLNNILQDQKLRTMIDLLLITFCKTQL